SLMNQGKETCKALIDQHKYMPDVMRFGCAATRFAASGCNALFVLLSLPVALPLAFPYAVWQLRFVLSNGFLWWFTAFLNLLDTVWLWWWESCIKHLSPLSKFVYSYHMIGSLRIKVSHLQKY